MDRGAWWATVHGFTKSQTQLNDFQFSATLRLGFPCGSAGKESACNERDLRLIPNLGRSPGEGNGYPL